MLYVILKAALSGILITAASEAGRRNATIGALIVSLPMTSLLTFLWLWRDTGDTARIANLSESTFWFIIPSLPMFLVFPAMLRHGVNFWVALGAACALTMALYSLAALVMARFGIKF
jgi:hypothetical protein